MVRWEGCNNWKIIIKNMHSYAWLNYAVPYFNFGVLKPIPLLSHQWFNIPFDYSMPLTYTISPEMCGLWPHMCLHWSSPNCCITIFFTGTKGAKPMHLCTCWKFGGIWKWPGVLTSTLLNSSGMSKFSPNISAWLLFHERAQIPGSHPLNSSEKPTQTIGEHFCNYPEIPLYGNVKPES